MQELLSEIGSWEFQRWSAVVRHWSTWKHSGELGCRAGAGGEASKNEVNTESYATTQRRTINIIIACL
ncbi:Protein of unknown function [Pyronema omphalodes CBS 100304]|uniref:Uncharacterized protein n=1 Tax=Pyronema omphalodes (strain CBS 100304) TaxID=1076935 RepID=U4KX97_PYROM|nr:Protein of unknown function [Pyronema omphalodes CBS 100304]